MISLLSMSAHILASAVVYILKAFFSLFAWFLRALLKAGRLLFVVLPVTTVVFAALIAVSIFLLCTGNIDLSSDAAPDLAVSDISVIDLPEDFTGSAAIEQEADEMVKGSGALIVSMYADLRTWWLQEVYSLKGSAGYIVLFFLTILMFIPVVTVLLCICVFMSYGHALFIGVILDVALYLVGAVLGKSFVAQAMGRYYRLFPDAGRRHDEKYHDRLLKKRNKELEDELRRSKEKRQRSFYEDDSDDYPDDEFDEEYEDADYEEDEEYPEDYEDDEDLPDEYEDDEDLPDEYEDEGYEDEDEYPEDYEDDEDFYEDFGEDYDSSDSGDDRNAKYRSHGNTSSKGSGSFNFFAGCNSLESADKKYKSLVKLYHPDNMDGDTAALQEINAQYAEVKKILNK